METRTSYSIKNLLSTIIPYIIIGVLGFIKIRVFVNNLSDDIVSLNQLFYQLFSYLALAEAGFGVFIIQKYYKSFAKNKKKEINEIFSTSIVFFKVLGTFIVVGGLIFSFFVNLLTKANVPNNYLQLIFVIFILKNSIEYFMMAPRFVIQADQKMYKINYKINLLRIIETIVEIMLVMNGADYLIVLLPGIPIRILFNIIVNNCVYKQYPWLKSDNKFRKKIIKGISNLISQKIAGILYSNTDIILISMFVNPISVVAYASYNYLIRFVTDTIFTGAQAFAASFANVLNKEKNIKKLKIFSELNMIFFFIGSICVVVFYYIFEPLITLWVGKEYLISKVGFYLILGVLFIDISKRMLYVVINAEGIFKETKNIIILEAMLNFVISLIFINKLGIVGVLIGTISSSLLTTSWYLPRYIYKNILSFSPLKYLKDYLSVVFIIIFTVFLISLTPNINLGTVWGLLFGTAVYSTLSLISLFLLFYMFFEEFRNLLNRGILLLSNLKKRLKK